MRVFRPWSFASLLSLLALLVAAPASASEAGGSPATVGLAPEGLVAAIAQVLADEGIPGVGIALVDRDGVRWAGGVGLADPTSGRPIDANTIFRVGSITKSFVALTIVALAERGQLGLDERLSDLTSSVEFDNPYSESDPITIAHLLEHTAGFDDMRFSETTGPASVETMALVDVLARNPRSRSARWRPGSRFSYSNPGYTVAAHVVEERTGAPYESSVRALVLDPLGMEASTLRRTPTSEERLAQGHRGPQAPTPYWPLMHRPAGVLMSSPRELAELVRLFLNDGVHDGQTIVSREGIARIERSGTLPHDGLDVSYGLGNYGRADLPVVMRGHGGALPGFLSEYAYNRELGVGYVMLLNSSYSPLAYLRIRRLLAAAAIGDRPLPPPPHVDVPAEELAAYAGYYELSNPRHALFGFIERAVIGLTIEVDGASLRARTRSGAEIQLIPTGAQTFRMSHESGSSVLLRTDGERQVLELGMAQLEQSSALLATLRYHALRLALLLMLTAILAAFRWIPGLWLIRGRDPVKEITATALTRGLPLLATISFFAMEPTLIAGAIADALGEPSAYAIALCLISLLFAATSGAALAQAIRSLRSSLGLWVRLHSLGVAIACFAMTLYLLKHNIIGLRTWAW